VREGGEKGGEGKRRERKGEGKMWEKRGGEGRGQPPEMSCPRTAAAR